MVDTKQKYGLSKRHAILLFIQMLLTIFGLVAQIGILSFIIENQLDHIMRVSCISIILSYIAIYVYAIYGYRRSKNYYIVAIALFLVAILINNILPSRDMFQKITLTLLFGIFAAYIFTQDKFKISNVLMFAAAIVSLAFSIYSAIKADVSFLGPVSNVTIASIMMYTSIFTPVIMSGVFGVTYLVRCERQNKQ